jgi:hypothetical protein
MRTPLELWNRGERRLVKVNAPEIRYPVFVISLPDVAISVPNDDARTHLH